MFEVIGEDIQSLNDTDLRTLVGLLCEADLRSAGLPTAGATWGGHQNAADGGIDVRVDLATDLDPDGYIPRRTTGYQVKKPDMPASAILEEMCPGGTLRPVFSELADAGGAYIIVCSSGSTSSSALESRRKAMKDAVEHLENVASLRLDFFDRNRVASWVRSHPGLTIWVRDKIGRPIHGWQAYGNWVQAPGGVDEEYFEDEQVRIHGGGIPDSNSLSVAQGIHCLRESLSQPGNSIRLVGLSGVGKTRLLQALFDERIGGNALDRSLAVYTDIADSPQPDSRSLANQLVASRMRAILIVDNCPPELHRRLTSVCKAAGSTVSVVTVEYDVRDDQPEGTEVFRMEPASPSIIEKIVRARYEHLAPVDAHTVAEFSGGNARIAIALADTVERGESLSGLRDEELFQRLFFQRHEEKDALLRAAEACSLVYSFEGETTDRPEAELSVIGALIGQDAKELFGQVAELKRRKLVQKRGVWRAVLPQALANRLALRALENLPRQNVLAAFEDDSSERLMKSFSRRIGFLHESDTARELVEGWLDEKGLLGEVQNLNDLGMAMLGNVAPTAPEATLEAIERAASSENGASFASRQNQNFRQITGLLRSLAYEPELFDRSVGLLVQFALSEDENERMDPTRDILRSLFFLYLSGTHAPAPQRARNIENLLVSENSDVQELGLVLLDAALEAWHFSAVSAFEFGARSRDYGFAPSTREEIGQWFSTHIGLAEQFATSSTPLASKVRNLIARKFRGLWTRGSAFDDLERVAGLIRNTDNWEAGWIAVRSILRFDLGNMEESLIKRVRSLEQELAPTNLLGRARAYTLGGASSFLDLVDVDEEEDDEAGAAYLRVERETRRLGAEIAKEDGDLRSLIPELVTDNSQRLVSFGQGLAEGTTDLVALWNLIREQLAAIESGQRSFQLVTGFLSIASERDAPTAEQFLDDALEDEVLGERFPWLQSSVEINERGIERLLISLSLEMAPVWTYKQLAYGDRFTSVAPQALGDILLAVASVSDGMEVSLEILRSRFHSDTSEGRPHDKQLLAVGSNLVGAVDFTLHTDQRDHFDYTLSQLTAICFQDDQNTDMARIACQNFAQALTHRSSYSIRFPHFLRNMAKAQPLVFLDELLASDEVPTNGAARELIFGYERDSSPLAEIPDNVILEWCSTDPAPRFFAIAKSVVPFTESTETVSCEWTPLAREILERAPDSIEILDAFNRSLRPVVWGGSRASIMEKRVSLFDDLAEQSDNDIAAWARREGTAFRQEIESELNSEARDNRVRNESFE